MRAPGRRTRDCWNLATQRLMRLRSTLTRYACARSAPDPANLCLVLPVSLGPTSSPPPLATLTPPPDISICSPHAQQAGSDCTQTRREAKLACYGPHIPSLLRQNISHTTIVWSACRRPHRETLTVLRSLTRANATLSPLPGNLETQRLANAGTLWIMTPPPRALSLVGFWSCVLVSPVLSARVVSEACVCVRSQSFCAPVSCLMCGSWLGLSSFGNWRCSWLRRLTGRSPSWSRLLGSLRQPLLWSRACPPRFCGHFARVLLCPKLLLVAHAARPLPLPLPGLCR